jgi:hypothetical protein
MSRGYVMSVINTLDCFEPWVDPRTVSTNVNGVVKLTHRITMSRPAGRPLHPN